MANYPVAYQPSWNYSGVGQQMYGGYGAMPQGQMPQQGSGTAQTSSPGLIWVDGEIGAKAYQMPGGWPANQPIALWDTNDTVIYLKSTNPMGMPNPLQKAHYTLEGTKSGEASRGFSGEAADPNAQPVTRDDLNRMKQELMEALNGKSASTENGGSGRRTAREE